MATTESTNDFDMGHHLSDQSEISLIRKQHSSIVECPEEGMPRNVCLGELKSQPPFLRWSSWSGRESILGSSNECEQTSLSSLESVPSFLRISSSDRQDGSRLRSSTSVTWTNPDPSMRQIG